MGFSAICFSHKDLLRRKISGKSEKQSSSPLKVFTIPFNSWVSAGILVELPVTMTPSLRKYSAALAVSAILTSAVIVCALEDRK